MQMFGRRAQEAVLCLLVIHVYTATTEQFVQECPHTKADWERESMTLQCKDPNYYHCLRDNNGRFLQLCSPRVWIQKEMCPEFNSKAGRIDVFECPVDQINCPQTIFWSNSAYLFPGCYQNSTTAVRTTTTLKPTTTIKTAKKNDNSPNLSLVLPIVVSVLIVIGAIVALVCYKRLQKGRENNEDAVLSEVETRTGNKTNERTGVCEEEQQRMIGEVISEEDSSTKRSCEVYIPDGPGVTGDKLIDSTRILVLSLLPTSSGKITVINEEAEKTFGQQYVVCRTLAYFLKHKQEQQVTVLLKDFDFNTSNVEGILKKLHDVVSKSNLAFVLTVPFENFSSNREEIMSIITKDPDIFKFKYV